MSVFLHLILVCFLVAVTGIISFFFLWLLFHCIYIHGVYIYHMGCVYVCMYVCVCLYLYVFVYTYIYISHLLNPFICRWTFRLFPCQDSCTRSIPSLAHTCTFPMPSTQWCFIYTSVDNGTPIPFGTTVFA